MRHISDIYLSPWALGLGLLLLACEDPSSSSPQPDQGAPDVTVDVGGETLDGGAPPDAFVEVDVEVIPDAGLAPLACLSSAGCNSEPGYEGTLCVDGLCAPCDSDAACEADPSFGEGAACAAGRCQPPCPEGDLGCDCFANDTCMEGECVEGVCVEPCPEGTIGCPCDGDIDNACVDGACVNGVCVDDCEQGMEGCACFPNETCVEGECVAGTCVVPCTPGELECACVEGACDEGTCMGNLCVDCVAGDVDCACLPDDTCSTGACMGGLCVDCAPGDVDCACLPDDTCSTGAACGEGGICAACPWGDLGCPCDAEGACAEGNLCVEGVCAECVLGTEGCPCEVESTCDEGLACHEDELCHPCDGDAVGCPCDEEITCQEGLNLICDAVEAACREPYTCETAPCVEHQLCREGFDLEDATCLPICEAGFEWDADEGACGAIIYPLNCQPDDARSILAACAAEGRVCVAGEGDADATCGGCAVGFVADGDDCRAPIACAQLEARCAEEWRACVEAGESSDAICGACLAPFSEEGGACVVTAEVECAPADPEVTGYAWVCESLNRVCEEGGGAPPFCGGCAPGFLEREGDEACQLPSYCADLGCAGLGRVCEGEPFAACGGCAEGLTPLDPDDPMSQCRDRLMCADLDCAEGEFCVESVTFGDAECVHSDCGEGQAISSVTGECVDCGNVCGQIEGETGRLWLYTREGSNACLCETEEGYYIDTSLAILPRPCDADGDGWVRSSARGFMEHEDDALRANARCTVKSVDRITLQNGPRQRLEILLCEEGPLSSLEAEGCPGEWAPMDLYESAILDDEDSIALEPDSFSAYVREGVGRAPRAAEVNPLTKACIHTVTDYNGNGIADLQEAHSMEIPQGLSLETDEVIWLDFSYFIELHRGWYEARPGEEHGTYVIAERSRCDTVDSAQVPFLLGYDDSVEGEYWRSCTRSRHADYDARAVAPGFDFGQWTCDAESGSCPEPLPPTNETADGAIPAHGLCEVALPDGDPWRGMNHHSQFRCAEVVSGEPEEAWEMSLGAFYNPDTAALGQWQYNDCRIACPEGTDDACEADCDEAGCVESAEYEEANPDQPILDCLKDTLPSVGHVGFAALRYLDADPDAPYAYEGGCIDEWQAWPELCPGYSTNPEAGAAVGDGLMTDFGALRCGCTVNYGGLDCDIGCPHAAVDDSYDSTPRDGWWLCGEIQLSQSVDTDDDYDPTYGPLSSGEGADGTVYILEGAARAVPVYRTTLCESEDCATGYVVF